MGQTALSWRCLHFWSPKIGLTVIKIIEIFTHQTQKVICGARSYLYMYTKENIYESIGQFPLLNVMVEN